MCIPCGGAESFNPLTRVFMLKKGNRSRLRVKRIRDMCRAPDVSSRKTASPLKGTISRSHVFMILPDTYHGSAFNKTHPSRTLASDTQVRPHTIKTPSFVDDESISFELCDRKCSPLLHWTLEMTCPKPTALNLGSLSSRCFCRWVSGCAEYLQPTSPRTPLHLDNYFSSQQHGAN